MTLRVLVVEDHPMFAAGLVAVLATYPDVEVVETVPDGGQAVRVAATGGADVVLMDLNLPSMSGVEATARITALLEPIPVLVLTMVDDDDAVMAALRAGARGYVLKGATGEQIVSALRTVVGGGAVFGAGVAARMLARGAGTADSPRTEIDGLTDRERQVLKRIAEGATNARIARDLGLSLKTVQNYVSRVLDKLQVSDRTQAALKAREARYRLD